MNIRGGSPLVAEERDAEPAVARALGAPPLAVGNRRPEVELLARVPLFAGLSLAHRRRLAGLTEQAMYNPGRVIVRRDDPARALYIIVDGMAKVVKGRIVTARAEAQLGPGDFFGELAILDGGRRTATVVATTPLRAIRIERAAFWRLLRDEPKIALKILEGMASRARKLLETSSL
jgi:CRP/FNR family transcriptional regulator, cyclic AMP receptor protein